MEAKPSWVSSTTSQLLVFSVLSYALGAVILIARGQATIDSVKWLIELLLPLYGVRTGANAVMTMITKEKPDVASPPSPTP